MAVFVVAVAVHPVSVLGLITSTTIVDVSLESV